MTHHQSHFNNLQKYLNVWRIKINENKSSHITFTQQLKNNPPITSNNKIIPIENSIKY